MQFESPASCCINFKALNISNWSCTPWKLIITSYNSHVYKILCFCGSLIWRIQSCQINITALRQIKFLKGSVFIHPACILFKSTDCKRRNSAIYVPLRHKASVLSRANTVTCQKFKYTLIFHSSTIPSVVPYQLPFRHVFLYQIEVN